MSCLRFFPPHVAGVFAHDANASTSKINTNGCRVKTFQLQFARGLFFSPRLRPIQGNSACRWMRTTPPNGGVFFAQNSRFYDMGDGPDSSPATNAKKQLFGFGDIYNNVSHEQRRDIHQQRATRTRGRLLRTIHNHRQCNTVTSRKRPR